MNDNLAKKELIKRVLILTFILFGIFLLIGVTERLRKSNAPLDSGAIFGGKLESGYPFVGYIVSEISFTEFELCGGALINKNTVVTASHCVDDTSEVFFQLGNFDYDKTKYIRSKEIFIHPNWILDGNISSDISIVILSEDILLDQYAEVATASTSCNYTVVGYGKDSLETSSPLRKSATLCVESTSFGGDSISFRGESGGLCFGDSGSPILETGTNKLISVASRIDACYTGNFATGANVSVEISKVLINDNNLDVLCGAMDFNNDQFINSLDLTEFMKVYSKECVETLDTKSCGSRDVNNDGVINLLDLSSFSLKYLQSCE